MINRKTGPAINKIDKLLLPEYETYTLPNGIKICEVNSGTQEIIKFEIFHKAGRIMEDFPLAGRAVSSLIKDGTLTRNSAQLSEAIDFYGASIKSASNMDYSYSTLFCLTKQFANVIPVLHDMYSNPSFPEDETEKFKNLNIQKLKEIISKKEAKLNSLDKKLQKSIENLGKFQKDLKNGVENSSAHDDEYKKLRKEIFQLKTKLNEGEKKINYINNILNSKNSK